MPALNESAAMPMTPAYRTIPILQADKSYSPQAAAASYGAAMNTAEQVRILIRDRAKARGLSLKALSERAGKNHAYFQQFIERGIPRRLPEDVRPVVAELLGIDEDELHTAPSMSGRGLKTTAQNARVGSAVHLSNTIPAYGHARGGKDGQFVLNGNKVADILAPPSLARVPDAYAVYVVGNSMEPRYFAGEAVFVNPRLPVRRGDFVVAQIAAHVEGDPPEAYIKRFLSLDAKELRLEQFNPKKSLKFPATRVVSVHRIVMGGDG